MPPSDVRDDGVNDETFFCLALSLVPGLGTGHIHPLLKHCGSASAVFALPRSELKRLRLSSETTHSIAGGFAQKNAEKALGSARSKEIQILSLFDQAYPDLLKQIFDPPVVLYCLGTPEHLRDSAVAVVGSRRCSVYGREITRKLARELASLGLTITSGMARGIDSQAHLGALEAGGPTIAILGSGVDVIYPRENRNLYARIREKGCVVSEFPCGSFPAPQNFPIRNRIICGLALGTLITEASEFSGSLITARLTLEQNREIWAVPGNVTSPGSYGPNYLIKQGAKVVLDTQDILEELPVQVLEQLRNGNEPDKPALDLPPEQDLILRLLPRDSELHIDQLLGSCPLEQPKLNEALLHLEMKGLIRQWPGRRFSRRLD